MIKMPGKLVHAVPVVKKLHLVLGSVVVAPPASYLRDGGFEFVKVLDISLF